MPDDQPDLTPPEPDAIEPATGAGSGEARPDDDGRDTVEPKLDEAESKTDEAEAKPDASEPKKERGLLREIAVILAVAGVLSFVMRMFFFQVYYVPSGSMAETLHGCEGNGCVGDRIVAEKLSYVMGDPKPGDIVVFKGPTDMWGKESNVRSDNTLIRGFQDVASWFGLQPPDENDLVKRVIAVGGQTIQCRISEGGVTVDGKLLDEPYLSEAAKQAKALNPCFGNPGATGPGSGEFGPVTIDKDRIWVMGDNRTSSYDSRGHINDEYHGQVPLDNVRGKVVFKLWPFDRIGTVSSKNPQVN